MKTKTTERGQKKILAVERIENRVFSKLQVKVMEYPGESQVKALRFDPTKKWPSFLLVSFFCTIFFVDVF